MGCSLQGFPHKPCLCHNGITKAARYRATWCQRKTDCFGGGISRQVRVSNPRAGYIWKSVSQMYYDPIWRSLTCLVGGIGWWAILQETLLMVPHYKSSIIIIIITEVFYFAALVPDPVHTCLHGGPENSSGSSDQQNHRGGRGSTDCWFLP